MINNLSKFYQNIKLIKILQVMYIVTIFPTIMMTILVIFGATLDGAHDGVIAYLRPDFKAFANIQVRQFQTLSLEVQISVDFRQGSQLQF